jgi:hypothetical protein
LPIDLNERAVIEAAARRGIAGTDFGYAALSERTIVEGVEILAAAVADSGLGESSCK